MGIDKTVIMHISDLHFGIEKYRKGISVYRKEIFEKLKDSYSKMIDKNPGYAADVLVVSGDIAFDGSPEDYEDAKVFFNDFLKISGITKENVILCFGNHDVDAKSDEIKYEPTIRNWMDYVVNKPLHRPDPNMGFEEFYKCTYDPQDPCVLDISNRYHRFENAEKFCEEMGFVPLANVVSPYKYAYGYRENVNGIDFIILNTEWDFWGRSDKEKNVLRIGAEYYRNVAVNYNTHLLDLETRPRFVVYHRPLECLHIHEQYDLVAKYHDKRTGNLIVRQNDVSLNGHMHKHNIKNIGETHTVITTATVPEGREWDFSWNIISVPKKIVEGKNECKNQLYKYNPSFSFEPWRIERSPDLFYIYRYKDAYKVEDFIYKYTQWQEERQQPNNAGSKVKIEYLKQEFDSLINKGLTPVFFNVMGTNGFIAMENDLDKKKTFEPLRKLLNKNPDIGTGASSGGYVPSNENEKVKALQKDRITDSFPIDPKRGGSK